MSTPDTAPFMTVQAAADMLAVSRWMVYRLIWDGKVEAVHVGRCRRIVRDSFEAYLKALRQGVSR